MAFVPTATHLTAVNHLARAREVFDIEIAGLKAVRTQLDDTFQLAVDSIARTLGAKGKIVVVGIGKSGNIGQKIAATLTSTGATAVVLHSVDALHGDLGILNDGDVILALSYSGETEELLNLLPAFKHFSVTIISFTAAAKSTLARHKNGGPEVEWECYPPAQLAACEAVSKLLVSRYHLDDLIGHDDCAPDRKVDPGPAFPMAALRQYCGFPAALPRLH